jgi:hypothetical protein
MADLDARQATSLPSIVAATTIGQQIEVVSKPTSAALIAAGLLSVIAFPAAGLSLLRRAAPIGGGRAAPTPSTASVLVGVEDRAVCRGPVVGPRPSR